MNELIILTGKYLYLVSVLAVVIFWLRLKSGKKTFVILTAGSAVVAFGLAKIIGHFFYNARPFVVNHTVPLIAHAADNGFPSDHTLLTALIGFVVLTRSRRLGWALLVVALLVGSARVAAGIHHPLDVAGSFVIAGAAVALVAWAMRQVASRKAVESAAV